MEILCRRRLALRKERSSLLCWPTSIFTMRSTCGPTNGGRSMPRGRSSFCDTPMTSSSVSKHERDAKRFMDEMRQRLDKFELSLHPEKTRLIEFGRYAARDRKAR